MNNAPVFIVDDDIEELEMVQEIWTAIGFPNQLEVFGHPDDLLERLKQNINPFIIICDVNLHYTDGLTLRKKLSEEAEFSYKSIPFVFWSTSASNEQIKRAYDMGGHGFFFKGATYQDIRGSLQIIMTYWNASKAPVIPKNLAQQDGQNSALK